MEDDVRSSPSLAKKLGIKPGYVVCLLDAPRQSASAVREVGSEGVSFFESLENAPFDVILFWPREIQGLKETFARLQTKIVPDGSIWAVMPKKKYTAERGVAFSWEEMQAAGLLTDLVDNKIASVTEEDYGTRFVIRKVLREKYQKLGSSANLLMEDMMMLEKIELSTLLPAGPERIYRAWLDSAEHTAFTGGAAIIEPQVGGAFSAWDGYIQGVTLLLEPYRRIVQTWRTTEFPEASADSRLEVLLEEVQAGTKLTLTHSEIPGGQGEDYRQGWVENYFNPMEEYFSSL